MTASGAGTLILNGSSNYSGPTNISNGVVEVNNGKSLGSGAGTVTVNSGAALQLETSSTYSNPLVLGSTGITGTDGGLRMLVPSSGNCDTYSGAISLTGTSRINNDLNIGPVNVYTAYLGGTTLGLSLNSGSAITDSGNSTLYFGGASGANFWTTVVAPIQAHAIIKDGSGLLALGSGPTTAGSNVTINGGELVMCLQGTGGSTSNGSPGVGSTNGQGWTPAQVNDVLNNGTFIGTPTVGIDLSGGSWSDGGGVSVTNSQAFNLVVNESSLSTINTLTLTGANNYTGSTNIIKGIVNIRNAGNWARDQLHPGRDRRYWLQQHYWLDSAVAGRHRRQQTPDPHRLRCDGGCGAGQRWQRQRL